VNETETRVAAPRILVGGFLMGLANLVPGVSGGTMILAVGLYDRFISAVAELSSLRWSRGMFVFLGLLAMGLGVALVGLAGPAVYLVTHYRWAMYSLFVGMTLGGAPELVRLAFPARTGESIETGRGPALLAAALGFLVMAYVAWALTGTRLPHTMPAFFAMGFVAASSMILPGISGSYLLLIFGVYDIVIGSLSASALREDLKGSLVIIGPVAVGAAVGIGALSNVLKVVLARYSRVSHAALLGLLLGSVLGLWPFQEARYPELLDKHVRKELAVEVVEAGAYAAPLAAAGITLREDDAKHMDEALAAGTAKGELKSLASATERYTPSALRIAEVIGLFLLGVFLVRQLAPKSS
jgi:putative membrane protein